MVGQILSGGRVYADAWSSPVEALGIVGGKIRVLGRVGEVSACMPAGSEAIDLGGATVIPGLVESHVHPIFFGLTQDWADCRSPGCSQLADIKHTLGRAMGDLRPGEWLRGWGYDNAALAENRHPDRHDLDEVSTEVPIVVTHISGHFLVANSRALELAGVGVEAQEPAEGRIVRDESGVPTGLLWEMGAVSLIQDALPKPDKAQLERAARFAMEVAASRGMTSLHDLGIGIFGGMAELDVWRELSNTDKMPVRVHGYVRGDGIRDMLDSDPHLFVRPSGGRFELCGAKYWSDGSIQGMSAALTHPYHCSAEECGDLLYTADQLFELIQIVEAAEGQCAVHANGDRAIQTVIEAYARVAEGAISKPGSRHRIEHLQMASEDDIRRLAAIGGGASIFVNHVFYWGDRHRDLLLGPERARRLDPGADANKQGLHFGLHSDCPITPMDALRTLWIAVERRTSSGGVLGPEQALSAREALHALTHDSCWLVRKEHVRGTLRPGMDADLAILDTDLLNAEVSEISEVGVLGTMVGGDWAYRRIG